MIQRGMKFKVELPDGPVRGCTLNFRTTLCIPDGLNVHAADIQEIFGSQFELPELGPIGTHGLANARDFESPVASFDVDQSPWEGTFRFPECLCIFSDDQYLM